MDRRKEQTGEDALIENILSYIKSTIRFFLCSKELVCYDKASYNDIKNRDYDY